MGLGRLASVLPPQLPDSRIVCPVPTPCLLPLTKRPVLPQIPNHCVFSVDLPTPDVLCGWSIWCLCQPCPRGRAFQVGPHEAPFRFAFPALWGCHGWCCHEDLCRGFCGHSCVRSSWVYTWNGVAGAHGGSVFGFFEELAVRLLAPHVDMLDMLPSTPPVGSGLHILPW